MMVELKSGETLNGHLVGCDSWMNLTMRDVTETNADGDEFLHLPEAYVRGNNVSVGGIVIGGHLVLRRRDGGAIEAQYCAIANIAPGLHVSAIAETTQMPETLAARALSTPSA